MLSIFKGLFLSLFYVKKGKVLGILLYLWTNKSVSHRLAGRRQKSPWSGTKDFIIQQAEGPSVPFVIQALVAQCTGDLSGTLDTVGLCSWDTSSPGTLILQKVSVHVPLLFLYPGNSLKRRSLDNHFWISENQWLEICCLIYFVGFWNFFLIFYLDPKRRGVF